MINANKVPLLLRHLIYSDEYKNDFQINWELALLVVRLTVQEKNALL